MVTYTEQTAYRSRDRNRRVVVLEGTVEAADSAASVTLAAANASVDSIESVSIETPVVNGSVLNYNASGDTIEFFNDSLVAQTTEATGDTFRVKVIGPVE